MNRTNLRKTLAALIIAGAATVTNQASADPEQSNAFPGYGMMGGPGMMHGYGMGPRMMGGYGMGPGMMGGYGMGPGMMHGYGMGPCMMGSNGAFTGTNLNTDQQRKINAIQDDLRHKHWALMGKVLDEQAKMNELYYAVPRDDTQISKSYKTISDLRQEMFESSLKAQKQIDAVINAK